MNESISLSEDRGILPLPLVIGVTGHRDLREEDRELLEVQVQRIFAELQSRYSSTPLILLSSLAEGADQLVARVALQKGVRLIVPLPMSRVLYEENFQTQVSRDEFNKLLQQAEWWFELPLLKSARQEEVQQQGLVRDHQYAQLGAYIVLHSQILIALWDGERLDKVGGTSQVVQFQLQGVPKAYLARQSPLDEPESGPVYQIVTPRVNNPAPAGRPFELRKLTLASNTHDGRYYERESGNKRHDSHEDKSDKKQNGERGLDGESQEFDRILQHLDAFNRDTIDLRSHLAREREQSKATILGDIDTTTLPPALKATLNRYAELFALTDSLAIYFRARTVNILLFLFSLFFIAVIQFDVFAHLGNYIVISGLVPENWGVWLRFLFLVFYLAFLTLAYYIWYFRATRHDYKNKYLDYRALAEGLRVQFFWRLAGVLDTVATHYLRKQKSELDWIRNCMRVANLLCDAKSGDSPIDLQGDSIDHINRIIVKQWVDNQGTYFARSAIKDKRKLEGNERWIRRFFVTGILLALILLILQYPPFLPQNGEWINNVPLTDLLIIIMSLVLVFAALREGYSDKMAYAEQVKQFQRMSYLFQRASQSLNDSLEQGKIQDIEYVIRELGEEALAENGDWVTLHRTRPISVPMGG